MSQQEMQFDNTRRSEAGSYDSGYGALPHNSEDYEASSYSQKIGGRAEGTTPDSAHLREHLLNLRVGVAITTLVLWLGFFLIAMAVILNNPTLTIIQPFIFVGLGIFTFFVILANAMINSKQV